MFAWYVYLSEKSNTELTPVLCQVDASVIPLHMGTHITRTVYGIAEKAASIIKSGN